MYLRKDDLPGCMLSIMRLVQAVDIPHTQVSGDLFRQVSGAEDLGIVMPRDQRNGKEYMLFTNDKSNNRIAKPIELVDEFLFRCRWNVAHVLTLNANILELINIGIWRKVLMIGQQRQVCAKIQVQEKSKRIHRV